MKKIFLSLLLPVLSLSAGDLAIYKSKTHMSFASKDFNTVVPNYMVNKSVREMSPEKLAAVLNSGNANLSFKECSDGNYFVDLQGRVKGAGWAGATLGAAIGYIVVPAVIILPSTAALYATKAAIHIKAGPVAGDAFQKGVIDNVLPKIVDVGVKAGDYATPVAAVVGGFFSGPA